MSVYINHLVKRIIRLKLTPPLGGLCALLNFNFVTSCAFKKFNSQIPAFETKVQQRANKNAVT